jgi:hypothetical protein
MKATGKVEIEKNKKKKGKVLMLGLRIIANKDRI